MTIRPAVAAVALYAAAALGAVQVSAQGGGGGSKGSGVPTFSKDVAPILYANCTSCHRPGEIAPMSLLTYKDSRPWIRSIAERVSNGTMPPWHADPAHGHFLNDRSLSGADRATIEKWAKGGAPEGNPADLPPSPVYPGAGRLDSPTPFSRCRKTIRCRPAARSSTSISRFRRT